MKKIVLSLLTAFVAGTLFVGCGGGEPRSIGELRKLPMSELKDTFETCKKGWGNGKFDDDIKTLQKDENYVITNWQGAGVIQDTSKYSKEFVECARIFKIIYKL